MVPIHLSDNTFCRRAGEWPALFPVEYSELAIPGESVGSGIKGATNSFIAGQR